MKICSALKITFFIPTFIVQDASYSEFNAALAVFGLTTMVIMCWFHLLFNVKKHESLDRVSKDLKDMVLVDFTRLHYCLQYEYEQYKDIVIKKWQSYAELESFVKFVIPQWFEGPFVNWQVWRSPPGFVNTNNPLESFNKIIKEQFTNYNSHPILAFSNIVMVHLITFYSINEKVFLCYRIPHKKLKIWLKS